MKKHLHRRVRAVIVAAMLPIGMVVPLTSAHAAAPGGACFSGLASIGQDTDCGMLITIGSDGKSHLAPTGQGPYDGNDDTLVGIVNNSSKPISSLVLSSFSNIFGFDGDGIDTFGVPGNSMDSGPNGGYGGPDAYFTDPSADQTTGTVDFIVPIAPNGGTGFFSLENSLANATTCQDAIDNSVDPVPNGPNIDATFIPTGVTVLQAAQLCGFQNFDWVQKVTKLVNPSPFVANNYFGVFNSAIDGPAPITSADVPFSDPPQGGGYTAKGGGQGSVSNGSYPFYYDTTVDLPLHELGGANAVALTYHDAPIDTCLPGGDISNTAACSYGLGVNLIPGAFNSFSTQLAGVNSDGTDTDLGIGFTWNDNYNGDDGAVTGVVSLASGSSSADISSSNGIGGVTITSEQETTTYQYDGFTVTGINGGSAGPAASMVVNSSAPAVANGAWTSLSAQLSDINSTPIGGEHVYLTLGTGATAQTCRGTSDATGAASCNVLVNQPLGPTPVSASFAGDSTYLASTNTGSTVVYGDTAGGTFVVGDISAGTLAPGQNVNFWGAQWSQLNQLSGGTAPSTFDGFENTIYPPKCEDLDTWTTKPLDSTGYGPPGSVPAYTAVIVGSTVSPKGGSLTGDMQHIVIVATNPGYGPSPSSPGTGSIVATLC